MVNNKSNSIQQSEGKIKEKRKLKTKNRFQALEQLDKMVENMNENNHDLPGMCYTAMPNSVSDSNMYKGLLTRCVLFSLKFFMFIIFIKILSLIHIPFYLSVVSSFFRRSPTHHHCHCHNYAPNIPNSVSFTSAKEQHQCCTAGYHDRHRMHTHACTIL